MPEDTIAAIATPPGRGGIGVVRISGPQTKTIANHILNKQVRARQADYANFLDSQRQTIDQGIAIFFAGPNSYTGEDTLELQGHGGPVVMDMLLKRVIELGARVAKPGEFTERAFLNDKLDLAQAEAVADLIDSVSIQAAKAASKSLQGAFSDRIHQLVEKLTELRVYVEAALDFPEEEIDFLADGIVLGKIRELQTELNKTQKAATQGALLREGMTIVIIGKPNVGKSSLINQLAGREAAIVTSVAGTTRDLIREHIDLDGLPLHIIDTAGLHKTKDLVEKEGIKRTWQQIEQADRVLLLVDKQTGLGQEEQDILAGLPKQLRCDLLYNKIDLSEDQPTIETNEQGTTLFISAKTGAGIELLRKHLQNTAGYDNQEAGTLIARRRHLLALEAAKAAVQAAAGELSEMNFAELAAEELKLAQQALGEITGEVTSEDLLGNIFSSFCIGK